MTYVLVGAIVAAVAVWLLWRTAMKGLRGFVRNLWPH